MTELTGVVLCGGAGRRMGMDKALLEVDEGPLVRVVADRLATVADPVLIASGDGRLPDLPYDQVRDARPDSGPLAGIAAAMRVADTPLVAVVAADMPYMSPSLISALGRRWKDEDVVVPSDRRGVQPLHAVYATSALSAIEEALSEGWLSVGELVRSVNACYMPLSECEEIDPSGRFAFNLNSPADLEEMHRVAMQGETSP